MSYRIVRKYLDTNHPDHNREIDNGLTLEEAQAHCSDDSTHEAGVWMDVFYENQRTSKRPSLMENLFRRQTRNPDKWLAGR